MTGDDGEFKFQIPANGDYTISVTKIGHCTKKFQVSTKGVPVDKTQDDFIGFNIQSISLFEPLPGIDYSVLNQVLVKVTYDSTKDIFDYDEAYSNQMLEALDRLRQLELDAQKKLKELEANYTASIKAGDKAFQKKDWAMAKAGYNQALTYKPAELYPKEQLAQIEIILKDQAALNKKSESDKAEAARLAKEKADKELADKLSKEEAAKKAEAARLAKEKADKELADKLSKEEAANKAEAARLAKEKAADKLAKEEAAKKAAADKAKATTNPIDLTIDKYKKAKEKADILFSEKKYPQSKIAYEEALIAKAGDPYAKGRLAEIEKLLKSDIATAASIDSKQRELLSKYSPGITEEKIVSKGVVILQRVLVKDSSVYIYQKKTFNWGGVSYFRDAKPITKSTFEQETKP